MFLLNNVKFLAHHERTIGDTQYPAGWFLVAAHRIKVGVTEVADIPQPNPEVFNSTENPDGSWTSTPRPVAEVKPAKLASLEAARDAATIGNVTAHGRQWQADERSQELLSSAITLAMAGAPLPAAWRDAANSNMPIAVISELVAIAGAMAAQTQAAYGKSWKLKADVAAALTPADVASVVW